MTNLGCSVRERRSWLAVSDVQNRPHPTSKANGGSLLLTSLTIDQSQLDAAAYVHVNMHCKESYHRTPSHIRVRIAAGGTYAGLMSAISRRS
jgi:hypothetical protein